MDRVTSTEWRLGQSKDDPVLRTSSIPDNVEKGHYQDVSSNDEQRLEEMGYKQVGHISYALAVNLR